ncbi:MAG: hypothetical protein EZS28_033538 [Streblomastix strix]|uniref:Uncharacterized protein n=1 Tax=Streblomastix strix TaxID=222440 RepID=A0A5J4UMG5_9EUKA|nr:MAG: hypothetical protein EZS28_033538 [Streblomastix strix]
MPNGTRNGKTYESTTPKAPTRKIFSSTDDKYADGQRLYGKLAEISGLNEVTINKLISESNWETRTKRRAGLSLMDQHMKLNNIFPETLLNDRLDVHVVNALAWINDRGGKSIKSNLISLKTHTTAVLAQFSSMPRIGDSPQQRTFLDVSIQTQNQKQDMQQYGKSKFFSITSKLLHLLLQKRFNQKQWHYSFVSQLQE